MNFKQHMEKLTIITWATKIVKSFLGELNVDPYDFQISVLQDGVDVRLMFDKFPSSTFFDNYGYPERASGGGGLYYDYKHITRGRVRIYFTYDEEY